MSADTWMEQPESPREETSAGGGGRYVRIFLATKARGKQLALQNGFTAQSNVTSGTDVYAYEKLVISNYEGKYDKVEIIFANKEHGSSGGGVSADGRLHSNGDEEWSCSTGLKLMTIQDASSAGLFQSAAVIQDFSEEGLAAPCEFPVPTLTRKLWTSAPGGDDPLDPAPPALPGTGSQANTTLGALYAEMGSVIGKFRCTDISANRDGAFLLAVYKYTFDGKYDLTQSPLRAKPVL